MTSGGRNMVLNTRERIVSTDFNRLQKFEQSTRSDVLRYLLLAATTEESNGVAVVPSAEETPLNAVVMSGGLARPQFGSTDLFIDPAVILIVEPDAAPSADDSPAKLVIDPGVGNVGSIQATLPFVANAGPDPRIDVVECRPIAAGDGARVVSTESRDVYDPTTGTFSPTSLTKVEQCFLEYRLRQGVAGSGYPGNVAGWLPLMVASVPMAAVNWDLVTCWDVRPLVDDYVEGASKHVYEMPRPRIVEADMLGANLLKGRLEGSFKHFVAGGVLPVGGIDLGTNDFGESGWIAALTDKVWYLWAAFPFNLPRWARYGSANPRIPGSFRGVAIGSGKRPASTKGTTPASALTFPTNLGFIGQTTTDAVALFAAQASGAGALYKAFTGAGGAVYTETGATPINLTGAGTTKTLTLDDAATPALIPRSARSLLVELLWDFETTGVETDSSSWFTVTPSIDGVDLPAFSFYAVIPAAVTSIVLSIPFEIPLRPLYPDLSTLSRAVAFKLTGEQVGPGLGTYGTSKAKIKGWKL